MLSSARAEALALTISVASVLVTACGAESSGPASPPPTPPSPTIAYVTITGQTKFEVKSGASLQAIVRMSDSTSRDMTLQATWTSSVPSIVGLTAPGQVVGESVGDATISASTSGVTGSVKVTVIPQPVVMVSLALLLQSPITVPGAVQFKAVGKMSDSTSRDVTSQANWSSSDTTVATVSSTGVVTAIKAGTTQIRATFGTFTDVQPVAILPDPALLLWSNLSQAAKDYYSLMSIQIFGLHKWTRPAIKFWAQSRFRPEDLQSALDFWHSRGSFPSKTFVIVADSASADVAIVWDAVNEDFGPTTCGGASNAFATDGSFTAGAVIRISSRAACEVVPEFEKVRLAHEIGHIFGLAPHTPPGTDIMGDPDVRFVMSDFLLEVTNFMEVARVGFKP